MEKWKEVTFPNFDVEDFIKNATITDIDNALWFASSKGNIKVVKRILQDTKIYPEIDYSYALEAASRTGQLEVVKFLLKDKRVHPNNNDNRAIREASQFGHADVVETLLQDKRVDPSIWGNSAIKYASQNGHLRVVQILLQDKRVDPSGGKNWAIRSASNFGHTEIVKILLKDKRVDPSAEKNDAIKKAFKNHHIEIMRLLLADKRMKNPPKEIVDFIKEDRTPKLSENSLQMSIPLSQYTVIFPSEDEDELNMMARVVPRATASLKKEQLKWKNAITHGDIERFIKEQDPSMDNNWPIRYAAEYGYEFPVSLLLQDSRVNPTDEKNYAIRKASEKGELEIVQMLMKDSRVDPSDVDNYAIRKAAANGHLQVVEELLKNPKVDPTALNNEAVEEAFKNDHFIVVERLLKDERVKKQKTTVYKLRNKLDRVYSSVQQMIVRGSFKQKGLSFYERDLILSFLLGPVEYKPIFDFPRFTFDFEPLDYEFGKPVNDIMESAHRISLEKTEGNYELLKKLELGETFTGAEKIVTIDNRILWKKGKGDLKSQQRYQIAAENGLGPTFRIEGAHYYFDDLTGYDQLADLIYYKTKDKIDPIIKQNFIDQVNKLHSLGICHSDLHGGNILVNTKTKDVKFIDFESCLYHRCELLTPEEAADLELQNIPSRNSTSHFLKFTNIQNEFFTKAKKTHPYSWTR